MLTEHGGEQQIGTDTTTHQIGDTTPYEHGVRVDWPGRSSFSSGFRRHSWGPAPPRVGSLLYHGKDPSGQMYRRNRFYDPQSGRFTQEDPIGIAGGLNVYGYANGDPITYSDPYGLSPDNQPPRRPFLGLLGNSIRARVPSEFGKDLFDHYWLGRGDMTLSHQRFEDIVRTAESLGAKEVAGTPVNIGGEPYTAKAVSFYRSSEYARAFGTATLYYNSEGVAVGFRDEYDFDTKPSGVRSSRAEQVTRATNAAASVQRAASTLGREAPRPTAYTITYGVGAQAP